MNKSEYNKIINSVETFELNQEHFMKDFLAHEIERLEFVQDDESVYFYDIEAADSYFIGYQNAYMLENQTHFTYLSLLEV